VVTCAVRIPAGISAGNDGEFLWGGFPLKEWQGKTYRWPGFWSEDFIVPPGKSPIDWYVDGTEYVPLPSDSPAEAAARVERFLVVRFDLRKDRAWLETRLAAHYSPAELVDPEAGIWRHPYATGLRAIERELKSETRSVVARRSGFGTLLAFPQNRDGYLICSCCNKCFATRTPSFRPGSHIGNPLESLIRSGVPEHEPERKLGALDTNHLLQQELISPVPETPKQGIRPCFAGSVGWLRDIAVVLAVGGAVLGVDHVHEPLDLVLADDPLRDQQADGGRQVEPELIVVRL
jgi:hypothetical protein